MSETLTPESCLDQIATAIDFMMAGKAHCLRSPNENFRISVVPEGTDDFNRYVCQILAFDLDRSHGQAGRIGVYRISPRPGGSNMPFYEIAAEQTSLTAQDRKSIMKELAQDLRPRFWGIPLPLKIHNR